MRVQRLEIDMSCYVTLPMDVIKPNPRNARTHSKKQIQQIARRHRLDRFRGSRDRHPPYGRGEFGWAAAGRYDFGRVDATLCGGLDCAAEGELSMTWTSVQELERLSL